MASLINTVKSKFLDAIRSVNPPARWKILVVDEHSQKLLGSVLKQFDILEENVTLIESITNHREPQPGFEAMYLLMPTTQNVERIVRDFSNGRQQYAAAHLFFIEGLPDPLFQRLTSSPAEPFLKGLQDLYINFWAIEAQTFSTQTPESFFHFYAPPRDEAQFQMAKDRILEHVTFTSKMITNVCITLNENPYIRYYVPPNHPPLGALTPHASTRTAPPPPQTSSRWRTNLARGADARAYESVESDFVTKLLALNVQRNLDEYKKQNPDFGKQPRESQRPRGTLIITDRSMDVLAPFVHEFTYQAMAYDLLPIENGKYTYKFQSSVGAYEDVTATVSDADTVWTKVRHLHMKEAIDTLMADFNQFMEDNAGFKGEGAANLNDMKDMLANLPQYQEQREKFSLHLNMAEQCMGLFEKDKLPLVAKVEQDCATGLTVEGKTPKSLVEEMVPLLDSREIINLNKVRMVALYIQFREGVPDEDRRRLYQHARLSLAEQDAVNALVHLGVRIGRNPGDKDLKKPKRRVEEDEYELSRFKPQLTSVIEEQAMNKLDTSLFPYVKEAPGSTAAPAVRAPAPTPVTSLRSQKAAWAQKTRVTTVEARERLIVFVAGGMTYSEIREAYRLSAKHSKEVMIGSSHAWTPKGFIDDLKVLDLGGVGSRAIPNGLAPLREVRSYQAYYDERYYSADAPAPTPRPPPALQAKLQRPEVRPSRISPSPSTSESVHSYSSSKDDKKKKKGLFRF